MIGRIDRGNCPPMARSARFNQLHYEHENGVGGHEANPARSVTERGGDHHPSLPSDPHPQDPTFKSANHLTAPNAEFEWLGRRRVSVDENSVRKPRGVVDPNPVPVDHLPPLSRAEILSANPPRVFLHRSEVDSEGRVEVDLLHEDGPGGSAGGDQGEDESQHEANPERRE
jgi:hypothetical protein